MMMILIMMMMIRLKIIMGHKYINETKEQCELQKVKIRDS